ncbi:DNA alkylation repair protein [Chloroflexota bacterium]
MAEPLKTQFFKERFFDELIQGLMEHNPDIDGNRMKALIFDEGWVDRELKERMRHATICLNSVLPNDYKRSVDVLQKVISNVAHYSFEKMIFPDYVELYGLSDWDISLPALELFTQYASAEFAVRPFIIMDQERMMAQMLLWAEHENPSVRRLASEGCRPRLPWAIALPAFKKDPSPIIPILKRLKLDDSESVRRSVANNLNDISKDNPDVTLAVLQDWQGLNPPAIDWITSHSLRTLIKAGYPRALALLGYFSDPKIKVKNFEVYPGKINLGGEITIAFEIVSESDVEENLMIDYIVHLVRANDKRTAKVFKLTKKRLAPGENLKIERKRSFTPLSTRKYYPGEHQIIIQINGKPFGAASFILQV